MKANLKQKVLCSLLAASAFGFAYSDSVYAASLNGNEINKVVTNDTLSANDSAKFVIGQGDIVIQTNGSVGKLMADYNKYLGENKSQLEAFRLALGNPKENGIIVGVVGGEAQFDKGLNNTLGLVGIVGKKAGLSDSQIKLAEKIKNINTLNADNPDQKFDKDINIIIGGKDEKGNLTQPVVLGLVGGDLSFNTNLNGDYTVKIFGIESNSKIESSETTITRNGSVSMVADSGNIFGAVGGSAAIAVGNINVKDDNGDFKFDINLEGNTKTTLEDVKITINDGTNVAGMAVGGAAIGLGGKAVSDVTGDTNLVIDSIVNGKALEGLTVGVAGGGVAASTLGGIADTTVGGNANISINNGLAAGVIGGGLAASVDAAGLLNKGNDAGWSDIDFKKDLGLSTEGTIVINGAIEGGKATSTVGGDVTLNAAGDTTVAGIVGGGIATSYHSYTNRDNTDKDTANNGQPSGSSYAESVVNGKTTINVSVNSGDDLEKVVANVKENFKDLDKDKFIENLKKNPTGAMGDFAKALDGQHLAAGVFGGGIAAAVGDANSTAKASSQDVEINLGKGYVVGTFGGGVAAAVHDTSTNIISADGAQYLNASAAVKNVEINVGSATKAIGVFGNGLVLGMEMDGDKKSEKNNAVQKGSNGLATAVDTTINVGGKADGVYGGGMIIANGAYHGDSLKVDTTGKNTINVYNGSTVEKLNYSQITGAAGVLGDKLPKYLEDLNRTADNVAIAGGSVVLGQGGYAHTANSEINVAGGTVNGDIVAGGIVSATKTALKDGQESGSIIDKSVINLDAGTVKGNVYAGGVKDSKATDTGILKKDAAESIVKDSIVNLNGANVEGEISGAGYEYDAKKEVYKADGTTSTLNISGKNTLTALEGKNKIHSFDAINVAAGSVTTVDGLTAGNTTALIDGNEKTITVENGAKLDISELEKVKEGSYLIAGNYNEKDSTLWSDSDLAYDRTEGFAAGTNENGKYKVTYKELGALSEKEQAAAVDSWADSLGEKGKNIRGIIEGMVTDMDATNAGAKEFFSDGNISDPDLTAALMLGEASGVTSNAVSVAGDMADNAVLRLSFTQDKVTGESTVAEDGGVWAKYIHNKHDVDDMASSMGGLTSTSKYDGIMVGAEFAKKGKVQSGVAFTYGDGDAHGMGTKNDFDMWGINVYGNVKNEDSNVIADIGFAKNTNDITGSALGKDLSADRDLNILTMGVRAEKLYTNGNTQVVPYAGLRYMSVDADSYTTYYNGKAAFENDADRQNIWTLPIGVSLRNETVTKSGWRFTPRADLSYIWAFGDTDNDMTVNAGSGYDTLSYTVMDSGSWLGALALEAAKDDWSYGVGYSYQKGSHAENNKWFVNVNYSF